MAGLSGYPNFQIHGLPTAQNGQPQQTPGRPCLLCLDVLRANAKGQLCHQGHFYCEVCIRAWFEAALETENEGWRPPRCCGQYMPPDPTIFQAAFVAQIERKNEEQGMADPAPGAAPVVPGPEDSRPFRLAQPAYAWEITDAARVLQSTQAARAAQVVQAAQALHAAEALRMAEGVQTDQLLRIAPALRTSPGLQATRLIDDQVTQLLQAFGVLHGSPDPASRPVRARPPAPARQGISGFFAAPPPLAPSVPAAPAPQGSEGLLAPSRQGVSGFFAAPSQSAQSVPAAPAPQGSQGFLAPSRQAAQLIRAPVSQGSQRFSALPPRSMQPAPAAQRSQGLPAPPLQGSQREQEKFAFHARALRSAQAILASQGLQNLVASAPQAGPPAHPALASQRPGSNGSQP